MKIQYAISADIGGSHIAAAAVNITTGKIIERTACYNSVNNKAVANEIIERWGSTIGEAIKDIGLHSLKGEGIAMPGPFDYINEFSLKTTKI